MASTRPSRVCRSIPGRRDTDIPLRAMERGARSSTTRVSSAPGRSAPGGHPGFKQKMLGYGMGRAGCSRIHHRREREARLPARPQGRAAAVRPHAGARSGSRRPGVGSWPHRGIYRSKVPTDGHRGAESQGSLTGALRGLWWISPTGAVALIVPVRCFLAASYPDYVYRTAWRTPKSLESSTVLMLFAGSGPYDLLAHPAVRLATPAVGTVAWLSTVQRRAAQDLHLAVLVDRLRLLGSRTGWCRARRDAGLILGALSGDGSSDDVKRAFEPITGITSFTQMGIGYVIIATPATRATRQDDAASTHHRVGHRHHPRLLWRVNGWPSSAPRTDRRHPRHVLDR